MTNLEKMNELVASNATKEQIINWAYINSVPVSVLHLNSEFETMAYSVNLFMQSDFFQERYEDEYLLWEAFLDDEYHEVKDE